MTENVDNYESYFGHPRATPPGNEFEKLTVGHLFGSIYGRSIDDSLTSPLDLRDRALVNVALFTAFGRERELRQHLPAAIHQGLGYDQLVELMIHIAHYAGWPAGHSGMIVLKDALPRQEISSTSRTDEGIVRELNENIVQWEQRRDKASVEQLDRALSPSLVFKRADQNVIGKAQFIQGLREPSPYKSRSTEDVSTHVLGIRALTTLVVVTENAAGELTRYRNVRFLARRDGHWQVDSWFNDELKNAR